ncbi:hypothetical protein UQ17_27450 [Escherichia coli]|nr:hypothetical protein UQ17_27450 [Escherichia coli]
MLLNCQQPLFEDEIITFSGVCQSGARCIIIAGGGGGFPTGTRAGRGNLPGAPQRGGAEAAACIGLSP